MSRHLTATLTIALLVNFAQTDRPFSNILQHHKSGRNGIHVFLTVSSLATTSSNGTIIERQLEMNWHGGKVKHDDTVSIFNSNPHDPSSVPLQTIQARLHFHRYFRTDIQFHRMNFTNRNIINGCLGYWIAYHSDGKIIDSNCLRARPYWLNENLHIMDNFLLRDLTIPGTHDSGSYEYYFPRETIINRYAYAQEESIFNQLVYGIRYLDLRVGYFADKNPQYWIIHSFVIIHHTLFDVLHQVRSFVEATNEFVILDFHRFSSDIATREDHDKLIRYIKDVLDPFALSRPKGKGVSEVRLRDVFANDTQRILISYNYPNESTDPLIWPPLCQIWGNKDDVESLKQFFDDFYKRGGVPAYLWSSMAELTADFTYIFKHPDSGLRELADKINRLIAEWFRELWWKSSNIIATDYFLGNDIINVAIDVNRKRNNQPWTDY